VNTHILEKRADMSTETALSSEKMITTHKTARCHRHKTAIQFSTLSTYS